MDDAPLVLHHLAIEPEKTVQYISSLQDLIWDSGEDEVVGPVTEEGQIEPNDSDVLFRGPPAFQIMDTSFLISGSEGEEEEEEEEAAMVAYPSVNVLTMEGGFF